MTSPDAIVLSLTEPGRAARLVVVSGQMEVGRSVDGVALDDPEASRVHARFRVTADGLEVTDLGSRNGTFVNGVRIETPTTVVEGGWIDIGACRFVWDDAATTRAASTDPSARRLIVDDEAGDGSGDPGGRTARRPGRRRELGPVVAFGVGLLVIVLLRLLVLQVFRIPSESMEPTLEKWDRVLAVTWGVRGSLPSYGDVVIFDSPIRETEGGERYLVKRVIGRPGDSLAFEGGEVLRNGERIEQPWLRPGTPTEHSGNGHDCTVAEPCVVPAGTVWVLGDNRTRSQDSRWFGPVSTDALVGRAVARVWPPGRLGGV